MTDDRPYVHCACGHARDIHEPDCPHRDCDCRGFVECHCNGEP